MWWFISKIQTNMYLTLEIKKNKRKLLDNCGKLKKIIDIEWLYKKFTNKKTILDDRNNPRLQYIIRSLQWTKGISLYS